LEQGSIQLQGPAKGFRAVLTFTAIKDGVVTLYDLQAGGISHPYLTQTSEEHPELLLNQWFYAPEANFYDVNRPGKGAN